ncbi:MAG: alpha/beta hydrolase [Candidatus Sericytochromatia bacterium]|nr:alpha/beta hydrolase [Candidatus Tanganyikabacteria bacterium]
MKVSKAAAALLVVSMAAAPAVGAASPRGTYVWPGPDPTSVTSPEALPAAVREVISAERAAGIQRGCETVVWRHVARPAERGVVILLHGYSAGTWQFDALGPMLHAAGHDVYAARLVGHGYQREDDEEDSSRLLEAAEWPRYHEFAESVYRTAATLGGPISVLAFSAGADVAMAILEAHPDVARAVLIAPFLSPVGGDARLGVGLARFIDFVTGTGGGAWLDTMPFSWGEAGRPAARAWGRPGHWDMKVGNVYGLLTFGQDVLAKADRIRTPLQLVSTGADDVAAEEPIRELYRRAGGATRNAHYHFPAAERVPHPMIHFRENPDPVSLAKVTAIVRGFLVGGVGANR